MIQSTYTHLPDPIHLSRTVPLGPDAAFTLLTRDIGIWWPGARPAAPGHTGRCPQQLKIEPHLGGRIIETTQDGRTVIWGRILGWDAGRYLAFSWMPDDPDSPETVVAISFHADGTGTRVELTHGAPDILGPLADAVSTCWLHHWQRAMGCYTAAVRTAHVTC